MGFLIGSDRSFMKQVTDIKKNGKRMEIFVEETYIGFIYWQQIQEYGLEIDKPVSEAVLEEIHVEMLKRGKRRVFYLLGRKDYSQKEIEDKLKQNGYIPEDITQIMSYFLHHNWINDQRYAESIVTYKADSKSRKAIFYDLMKKGIDKDVIDEVLENVTINDFDSAMNALRKKFGRSSNVNRLEDEIKLKKRMQSHLAQKGYAYDVVNTVMKAYLKELAMDISDLED